MSEPDTAALAERVRRSGTSFYAAMRLLPRPRREAMYAVYAFCREVDDIADGPLPRAEKLARLEAWRGEVGAVVRGTPREPIARALAGAIGTYGLREEDLLAVIDGVGMDATGWDGPPTMAALRLYAARVAGAVGRLSVRVFGWSGPDADVLADTLGRALQFTNMLRDLAEDAAIGRLYLPQELLDLHRVRGRTPAAVLADPALPAVCADLAAAARYEFAVASRMLARAPRGASRPARLMAAVYKATLDRLERRGWTDIARPVKVPKAAKLWILVRHGLI